MVTLTAIDGLRVGHAQDEAALTGCTVVLCPPGTIGGVDVRGGAAGTRQTDALGLLHLVPEVHAVLLTGGSAYGLEATTGVMRWLEERGVGFDARVARVPVVPTAVLFDLALGQSGIRPDAAMGYAACEAATREPPAEGSVGAGTGATVGKVLGLANAMRGGIGSAGVDLGAGLLVAALVAVNAFGDVVDPASGQVVAGARRPGTNAFAGALAALRERVGQPLPPESWGRRPAAAPAGTTYADASPPGEPPPGTQTVIGVVATNAALSKGEATKVAQMAHDGLARAVRPAHTMVDGDVLFALATGSAGPADTNVVGAFAAEVVAQAIVRAVQSATSAAGLPAARDL
jgi:L-aminopeptidase/D-esterase-like protein